MIFSRKATIEDFHKENINWDSILRPELKQMIHQGNKLQAANYYRKYNGCGIQEAKRVINSYMNFQKAWDDFGDTKDVFVQYDKKYI
ncbi:hypothetical protein [Paenibacillus sp. Marseille-Q4541]|uniref:hypothetical protein n=1 Tax=Paenibacillus sp. Marseille-Q4541 TaxID=2831522 RepID=UPI001BA4F705|nr:hypothetical protein [Paenibacillus sp. Marseille-Q4541]